MTVFEHTMVGINGVVALGLHHRAGWRLRRAGRTLRRVTRLGRIDHSVGRIVLR